MPQRNILNGKLRGINVESQEIIEKLGEKQVSHIQEIARIPKPEIQLIYFRSDKCPHCRFIEPFLYKFLEEHPEISLVKIDADASVVNTNILESVLKGDRKVPTVVVNNQIVVTGETDFILRLSYAINLAKSLPPSKEENVKWQLKI